MRVEYIDLKIIIVLNYSTHVSVYTVTMYPWDIPLHGGVYCKYVSACIPLCVAQYHILGIVWCFLKTMFAAER